MALIVLLLNFKSMANNDGLLKRTYTELKLGRWCQMVEFKDDRRKSGHLNRDFFYWLTLGH